MQEQYSVRRGNVSCEEANRYAFRTVRALGYDVTAFEPAAPARPGVLKGSKRDERDALRTATVRIECRPDEVYLSGAEDQLLKQDLTFSRGFYLGFTSLADHAVAGAAYAEEQSGGVRGGGVKFRIKPQLGLESKLDFGEDLAAGGVLAVKVTVQNGSDRAYTLDPAAIELRPRAGGKVQRIPVAAAAAAVARAAAAQVDEGVPPPEPGRIEAVLRENALAERTLRPGEQAEGFVYFPVGDYARARATLVDVETSEGEGFLVEF
jgi:hypothetical protein